MEAHRLRAPRADGALLAEPPLAMAGPVLDANAGRLTSWGHDFQGRTVDRLRAMARQQVHARARAYHERLDLGPFPESKPGAPWIVTGHQPEMFHPGVWIKNFAIAGLARQHAGTALNLIVDNDIPKWASIRVPEANAGALRTRMIDFDDWAGEVPFEDWNVSNEPEFASFGDRVRASLAGLIPDPLIADYWPLVARAARRTDRVGLRLAAARRALEGSWGVANAEVPLGAACETEAFLWFASHILAQLPRFRAIHNDALTHYRALYGIRSRHHPVPALTKVGDWLEAPFWIWRADQPRRRPLFARQLARTMQLRIGGEDEPLIEIPLGPDREACCAVEQLLTLPGRGVRLRTRALTTTMFARLLLSDLFVHGIGGAKYDELGDELIRGFFGIEPPAYLTLSLTVWLGLDAGPATPERLEAVDRALRALKYNPDRQLDGVADPEVRHWVEAKRQALASPVATRRQRVARFATIRRCNEALRPALAPTEARLIEERAQLAEDLRRRAIAQSRDFAWVLHSRSRLRETIAGVVPGLLEIDLEK
jgi:hypothetical protein